MADAALRAEVETELARARDVSETRTVADLREATGAGHDDLMATLDELRQDGRISEVAPGEYLPFDSNAAAREEAEDRGQLRGSHAAEPEEPGISLAEAERGRPAQPGRRGGERKTTLTAGVASALEPNALGALVKAGIDEAVGAGATFVFEVVP